VQSSFSYFYTKLLKEPVSSSGSKILFFIGRIGSWSNQAEPAKEHHHVPLYLSHFCLCILPPQYHVDHATLCSCAEPLSVCKKGIVVPLLCIGILAHVMSELWRGSGSHARPPSFRWNRYLRTTSVVKVPGVPSKIDRGRNTNPTVTLYSSNLSVRDILRLPKTDINPPPRSQI
jgi:hypothetical protein